VAHLAGNQAGVWTWEGLARLRRDRDVYQPAMPEAERREQRGRWARAVARARGRAVEATGQTINVDGGMFMS
jgi:glycerol kinase